MVAACASQGGALLTSIIAARVLGRESFGEFGAVQTTVVSVANVASAGLGISATQYLAQTSRSDPQRAGRVAGLLSLATAATAMLLSLLVACLAPRIAGSMFGRPDLLQALRPAVIYVFFATLNGYQAGALVGLRGYRALTVAGVSQAILMPGVTYGLTRTYGVPGAVLALDCAAVWLWIVQCCFLRREYRRLGIRPTCRGALSERRVFSHFALPAACSGVAGNVAIWISSSLLVRSSDGLSQYALFTAANNLRAMILFAPAVVNKVAVPVFARLRIEAGVRYRESFWSNVQLNALLAALIGGALVLAGEPLLRLFGRRFSGSGLLATLAVAACFEVVASALYQALLSRGAIWTHVGVMAVWSGVLVGVTWLFADRMGGGALALAYCLAWCASAAAYAWIAVRFLPAADCPPRSKPAPLTGDAAA